MKIERSDVVALKELGYGEGCSYIEAMHKREMALRVKDLNILDKSKAKMVASKTRGEIVDFSINESTEGYSFFAFKKFEDLLCFSKV